MTSASRRALLLYRALQAGAASRSVPTLLRPLAAAASLLSAGEAGTAGAAPGSRVRCFATQPATSSLQDSSPNWSKRPPKETILLDGCDFEHWLVVMYPPPGDTSNPDITRDEIIDSYIKTLAQVVGSDEEARKKIYSVSTRHYFAFGALVAEELSDRLKELPKVRWVIPDSYSDQLNFEIK
ncbi:multiple organellar RNA editing factor 8, chloroplastic/mitochondrial-like isoform X2 [Miscanthus floridulus]|uniref:multiple organellar RNA editing factor 8, chloroplastic/mitochondrial-like isoform X2 n=1 Tax=Miscanthus floridulus TaxID=154761 RepID=UPI00345922F3